MIVTGCYSLNTVSKIVIMNLFKIHFFCINWHLYCAEKANYIDWLGRYNLKDSRCVDIVAVVEKNSHEVAGYFNGDALVLISETTLHVCLLSSFSYCPSLPVSHVSE